MSGLQHNLEDGLLWHKAEKELFLPYNIHYIKQVMLFIAGDDNWLGVYNRLQESHYFSVVLEGKNKN